MKKYVLVKGEIDYADEFYCEMFGVFEENEWKERCERVKKAFKAFKKNNPKVSEYDAPEVEVYFGTNECLLFSSYKEWVNSFTVKEITEEQATFLKENFNGMFGTGSNVLFIDEQLAEEAVIVGGE